jgi:hypothetical protein
LEGNQTGKAKYVLVSSNKLIFFGPYYDVKYLGSRLDQIICSIGRVLTGALYSVGDH